MEAGQGCQGYHGEQKDLQAGPQWQHLTISLAAFKGIAQEAQDITAAEERASSVSRQSRHMESFDDLDLERAPQDWQIDPALSMLPYGGISSVILSWNPADIVERGRVDQQLPPSNACVSDSFTSSSKEPFAAAIAVAARWNCRDGHRQTRQLGSSHLALLHGCHLTIYGVTSISKTPVLTSASAQRLTWDQAEEIPLHDGPTRNSAAGNESPSGASATNGKAVDDSLHRTTSAGPLSRLTSALRADLDLLTRCVSAPAQLVEAAESLSSPASQCEPRPAQGNPKGIPAHDLSFDVHLRVKTGLPSVHGQHHKKTPRVPKPEDSGDLRQAINTITSVPVGLASGLNRRMSSGQDRRVSFAELDEVVGDGHSTKYPPSPHPRKLSGNSGASAAPQRSALKPASAMTRLSNGSQERVLVTALRATFSADDEQCKAAAIMEGAAYDEGSCPSDALGEQHMARGSHAAENSEEEPAALPPAASEHGALRAKVARLKAQWLSMLKPATATRGDGSKASERGVVPSLAAARLERPKGSSAPNLGRPSVSHQALSGPVVESRMTGWLGAGTGVGEQEGCIVLPGSQNAGWMQHGHAGEGALQASLQAPDMMQGNDSGQDAAPGLPAVAVEEDISDSEWLPNADLWGPTVCVLPAQHEPDPIPHIPGATSPAAASPAPPRLQRGTFSERSHLGTFGRIAGTRRGPGPVAESVEEGEDEGMASQDPHAARASAEAHADARDEHIAPSHKPEGEALTLDQQLSGGRPRTPLRPKSSSGLPRQVDAETSASLDRYYSLPATLALRPTVCLDAPLLQSRTSLLPGAWASGAFGDALDEFFLDSPTMLDSPVLDRGEPTFEHSIMEQRAKTRDRRQLSRKRSAVKRSGTKEDPPQVNVRSSAESAHQVSPHRSLSPLAGRFAFSWHRAAQDTSERKTEEATAEHTITDSRVHLAVAADDGPPKQLADYMHTGPGPLEEGLAIARSSALLLNTPDPLRLDPMRTLGSMRRRRSTTSSEGSQQRLRCGRDPLNQDTVQYAASPLRRMQTLAEAEGPGGTSPVQAIPTGRTRQRRTHASVTGDSAPRVAAGCEYLQNVTTTAAAAEHGKDREQAQETARLIKAGVDNKGAAMEKTARAMHRAESSSVRKSSAGKAGQASGSHRVQVESNAESSPVLPRSLSSSSLDVYYMLKARSRRARRNRHAQLTEQSSLSSPSSPGGHSVSLGEHAPCRHLSTPRLLRPDSLWMQKQHPAVPADHSGIRLVDVDWRWEAGAAKKAAAARRIQAVYRGHAARRTAALLRLAQQQRRTGPSPKTSTRDAAVQANMPSSAAAQTSSDLTKPPQGTRPDGLYRAVPVRAVYVRPGTSLIKATTGNEQAAAQQSQPQPAQAATAAEVAALESLRARMSHTGATGARCHSLPQESEGDWYCPSGGV
ncbi:g7561 [Coccomyxa elongata]